MKYIPLYILTGILVFIALIGLWAVASYNTMVGSRNGADKAWAQVETRYQRRYDLIGNLVESVKGAQGQEQKVFGDIAQARTKYAGSQSTDDKARAATQLEGSLGRLLVITENYPDLKSNSTVAGLMTELRGTEDQILSARDDYNDAVNRYNTGIERFPRSIFAAMFGFHDKPLFKVVDEAKAAPKVKF
jgi:LemA protein